MLLSISYLPAIYRTLYLRDNRTVGSKLCFIKVSFKQKFVHYNMYILKHVFYYQK